MIINTKNTCPNCGRNHLEVIPDYITNETTRELEYIGITEIKCDKCKYETTLFDGIIDVNKINKVS